MRALSRADDSGIDSAGIISKGATDGHLGWLPSQIKDLATMERVKGIEPSYEAWEAAVLPLNYTRGGTEFTR
jgi:hypothetical protein